MPYLVIVDPLSTGQEYPAAFAAAGVEAVAVLSTPEPAAPYRPSWHPENFRHIHPFSGVCGLPPNARCGADLDRLATELRGYQPICVIPGAETGVQLADALCERLVPGSGNMPALSSARRNKWAMAQAVAAAGIPYLRQICSADQREIAAWLGDNRPDRFVIKPPQSAGTDNVHLVASGKDWRRYFDQIYGHINMDGIRNDAVLVQDYADGPEFLVDSYSVGGEHGLVDVCRYAKTAHGDRIGIYKLIDFLPPDDPEIGPIWQYVRRVLDAVGIRNGPGHTEVVITRDGPRLLETAARPAGGGHQMITELATGSNQIARTVAHRVHGRFERDYQLRQHVCSVVVHAPVAGIWRNPEVFAEVDALPTFWAQHFYFGTGDQVPAPEDIDSMLGWVVLAGPDRAAMQADIRRIRELESQIRVDHLAETPVGR